MRLFSGVIAVLVILSVSVFAEANPTPQDLPANVVEGEKSVFRFVMVPPREDIKSVPIEVYEKEIVPLYGEDHFIGWWLREVLSDCKEEGKEKCPLLVYRVVVDGKVVAAYGSAFLAGDSKTLYTAAHIWPDMFNSAGNLGQSKLNNEKIKKIIEEQLIGLKVDFILFDGQRNIVYNSLDSENRSKVKEFVVPTLIGRLHPELKLEMTTNGLEYFIISLGDEIDRPVLEFASVKKDDSLNGINVEYGEKFFSLGYPADPEFDTNKRVIDGKYHDYHVVHAPLTRKITENQNRLTIGDGAKETIAHIEKLQFVLDATGYSGMSGGPIVDGEGRVVSLNARTVVFVEGNIAPNIKVTHLMSGPIPTILPGIK